MKETLDKLKKINILGVDYDFVLETAKDCVDYKDGTVGGYCNSITKTISLLDAWSLENNDTEEEKDVLAKHHLRHEILHAYLYESGLYANAYGTTGSWTLNEEMIDWFALQFHKIKETYEKIGI